jgi:two-component system, OmpR family, phosphate regulon sensor histidine kinase PhoR
MDPRFPLPGKRLALLLGVVVLPSVLLLALGVRAYRQEQVVSAQARAETRRQLGSQLGRQLALLLGQIRLQQVASLAGGDATPAHPAVVLTVPLLDGRIQPPTASPTRAFPAAFSDAIRSGESAEFSGRHEAALRHYRAALSLARDTLTAAQARLRLARQFARTARADSAAAHYLWLLALPFTITDDEDIPFALYAAERLRHLPGNSSPVAARVAERLGQHRTLPRLETYLLRDIAESLVDSVAANALRPMVARHLATTVQLAALERDLPTLLRLSASRPQSTNDAIWIPYGDPLWLLSAAQVPGRGDSAVVIVEARRLESSLAADLHSGSDAELKITAEPGAGEPLAPAMPGLFAVLPDDPVGPTGPRVLLLTLTLLVALTALSGHLLWRDVRRESRVAALRSRFVSAVSHELKTPLTSIRMFAEMLRMRPDDEANRTAFLDTIAGESERLTRLIENVLHFSRLEEGRQTYHRAPTDLAAVAHDATRAMGYPLGQEGLRLRLEMDGELPLLQLDRDAVMQALLNLLSNAVKFSPQGGEIVLRVEQSNGNAVISVRDEGIGIERSEHRRIFEEFHRAPGAVQRGVEGTGLGLALVADVVRAHGGRIELESAPGKGSTFTLFFPVGVSE